MQWLHHQSDGETHQLVKGEDTAGDKSCDQTTPDTYQYIFFLYDSVCTYRYATLLQKLMSLYQVLIYPRFNGCMGVGTSCPEAKQGRDRRIPALEVLFNTQQPSDIKTKQTNKAALRYH